jgi:tight adherence protein C
MGTDLVTVQSVTAPTLAAIGVTIVGAMARPLIARHARADLVAPPGTTPATDAPVRQRSRRAVTLVLAAILAVATAPIGLGAAVVTTLLVRRLRPIRTARRQRAAIERALPDAMDLLVLSVRAGLTPFQAVGNLATSTEPSLRVAFEDVVRRTERGQPFADALGALPEHLGAQAGGLADVIATSDRHGLALGPVLDQLTAEVRSTRRRLDEADARKLPVRLSFPLVVCTLPSFVLLAIAPAVIAALSSLGGTAW